MYGIHSWWCVVLGKEFLPIRRVPDERVWDRAASVHAHAATNGAAISPCHFRCCQVLPSWQTKRCGRTPENWYALTEGPRYTLCYLYSRRRPGRCHADSSGVPLAWPVLFCSRLYIDHFTISHGSCRLSCCHLTEFYSCICSCRLHRDNHHDCRCHLHRDVGSRQPKRPSSFQT